MLSEKFEFSGTHQRNLFFGSFQDDLITIQINSRFKLAYT